MLEPHLIIVTGVFAPANIGLRMAKVNGPGSKGEDILSPPGRPGFSFERVTCGEKSQFRQNFRLPRYCLLWSSTRRPRSCKANPRAPGGDESATISRLKDGGFESLTTRLRPHRHAGPEQATEKCNHYVCPSYRGRSSLERSRTYLPRHRCPRSHHGARRRDHRRRPDHQGPCAFFPIPRCR